MNNDDLIIHINQPRNQGLIKFTSISNPSWDELFFISDYGNVAIVECLHEYMLKKAKTNELLPDDLCCDCNGKKLEYNHLKAHYNIVRGYMELSDYSVDRYSKKKVKNDRQSRNKVSDN